MSSKQAWVDFKEVRASVKLVDVLESYDVQLRGQGDQRQGFCPLPEHEKRSRRKSPSFSANLAKNVWRCFACGAQGNVIDFTARMEGLDPDNPADVRKAALLLQERHLGGASREEDPKSERPPRRGRKPPPATAAKEEKEEKEGKPETQEDPRTRVINAPLDFELKSLDASHPYLAKRGLAPETVARFGLGFCARGLMAGRIAIPIHDGQGRLVGYAGRLVDEASLSEENPKYKLPGEREKEGAIHAFRSSLLLYNAHRVAAPARRLIVVEGYPSVWSLCQAGHGDVVALMGAACSEEQAALIAQLTAESGEVWAMPDGDDAGRRCALELLEKIGPHRRVRWVKLRPGEQPDACGAERLAALLGPLMK